MPTLRVEELVYTAQVIIKPVINYDIKFGYNHLNEDLELDSLEFGCILHKGRSNL